MLSKDNKKFTIEIYKNDKKESLGLHGEFRVVDRAIMWGEDHWFQPDKGSFEMSEVSTL